MNNDDFAIVIGINRYDDKARNLTSPVCDAKAVADWLTSPDGGAIPAAADLNEKSGQCLLLLSEEGSDKQVGEREIRKALQRAASFCKDRPGRRLYFYFSGHGIAKDSNDVLMCHSEWDHGTEHANISSVYLHENFFNRCCGGFDEVVMWIDCCRNEKLRALPASPMMSCRESHKIEQKRLIVYATSHGASAFEATDASHSGLSIFTEVLLEGLKYAKHERHNAITWESVNRHLNVNVPLRAKSFGKNQRAQIEIPQWYMDDPVYSDKVQKIDLVIELEGFEGLVVLKDNGQQVATVQVEDDHVKWPLKLSPRLYQLHLPDGREEVLAVDVKQEVYCYECITV